MFSLPAITGAQCRFRETLEPIAAFNMLRPGLLLLLVTAAYAQTSTSLETVIQQARTAYRTDFAMGVMRDVYASDRFFTFPHFLTTAEYLKGRMQQIGLTS